VVPIERTVLKPCSFLELESGFCDGDRVWVFTRFEVTFVPTTVGFVNPEVIVAAIII